MMDLARTLEDRASRATPSGSDQLRQRVAVSLASKDTRLRLPRRAWAIAVAAAVITVLAIAVPLLVLGGGSDEAPVVTEPAPEPTVVTTVPPPTTEASTEATPTTGVEAPDYAPPLTSRAAPNAGDWTQVIVRRTQMFSDVRLGGPGLLAAGIGPSGVDRAVATGSIWTSANGTTWEVGALPGRVSYPQAVVDVGQNLVAVGLTCDLPEDPCPFFIDVLDGATSAYPARPLRAAAWTSSDGGATWVQVPDQAGVLGSSGGILDAVLADGGLVAVGSLCDTEACRPAVWTSPDGEDWTRSWEGDLSPHPPWMAFGGSSQREEIALSQMQSVVVGPGGRLVAVGVLCERSESCAAAVWTSSDGDDWEQVARDPAAFGEGTAMFSVALGRSGLVAVGAEGASAAVWTSADGVAWARVEDPTGQFASFSFADVAAGFPGYVAVGPTQFDEPMWCGSEPLCPRNTVWTSPDGRTWTRLIDVSAYRLLAVTAFGRGLVAAGQTSGGAAVWVAVP